MDYLNNLEKILNTICKDCNEHCIPNKCLIGFTLSLINNFKNESIYVVENGRNLIPNKDTHYYEKEIVADAIANICKLCKQCKRNHTKNCIISLIKDSLELTQLAKPISYGGNIITYFNNISNQDTELASLIHSKYIHLE
ncbi:hypothetical protein OW763_09755 [Clostridium aestuarii]|uniref:Uncharacterized protein n=1 Tax=Clostridium aestuarii TaxID=338193 RepID=A0ABT4D058_9CLOT|nr:hypothetical protein [Clostridium aestuarii]MCY6484623.1 hypothetical protein [Clostridium aestuarii]